MYTKERLAIYAREIGSRANTIAGQWRAVKPLLAAGRITPLCTRERQPRDWRALMAKRADEQAAGHARAAAMAAGFAGANMHMHMIGACLLAGIPREQAADLADRLSRYIRLSLGLGGQHPLRIVAGGAIRAAGRGYDFRWRGRWKSAPGSYIPSTLHGRIGLDWVRAHADADPRRWRGPGGGWYLRGRGVLIHGFTAYPAVWRGGTGYIVAHPALGRAGYHARVSTSDVRVAIKHAIAAARSRRAHAAVRAQLELILSDPQTLARIFVCREDSVAAGNCVPGTEWAARYIAAHLHAPASGVGAVRADFLLATYPGERTEAAVAAAARRMGYA